MSSARDVIINISVYPKTIDICACILIARLFISRLIKPPFCARRMRATARAATWHLLLSPIVRFSFARFGVGRWPPWNRRCGAPTFVRSVDLSSDFFLEIHYVGRKILSDGVATAVGSEWRKKTDSPISVNICGWDWGSTLVPYRKFELSICLKIRPLHFAIAESSSAGLSPEWGHVGG